MPLTSQRAFIDARFIDPTEGPTLAPVEQSFAYFGFIWPVGAREFV